MGDQDKQAAEAVSAAQKASATTQPSSGVGAESRASGDGSDGGGDGRASSQQPEHPPTLSQLLWTIVGLSLTTILVLFWGRSAVLDLEKFSQRENKVSWLPPAQFVLKPGPPTFWYDAAHKQLVHVGAIDQKRKVELVGLATVTTDATSQQDVATYWAAIDALAYQSNRDLGNVIVALLVLGGIAGATGVQLRSLVNFVGHACYTRTLDLVVWWPYYVARPLTGFLLGIVVVVVTNAGFFVAGDSGPSGTMWWAALAFLAGFGESEFTQKLRQLTKTLFGDSGATTRSTTTASKTTTQKPSTGGDTVPATTSTSTTTSSTATTATSLTGTAAQRAAAEKEIAIAAANGVASDAQPKDAPKS